MKKTPLFFAAILGFSLHVAFLVSSSVVVAQQCFVPGANAPGATQYERNEVDCGNYPGMNWEVGQCYDIGMEIENIDPVTGEVQPGSYWEHSAFPCDELDNPLPLSSTGQSVDQSGDVGGTGSDELDGWLNKGINVLSALIGLAVVISILVGAIQYVTAGGNAAQVGAAKQRITMAVLGLALFLMGYAILQWLIPGGLW